jgi:hypothetical protein
MASGPWTEEEDHALRKAMSKVRTTWYRHLLRLT